MKYLALLSLVLILGCTQSSNCGVQECHGLDVTCGSNVPEVCTTLYKLGDFCRAYINCSVVDGVCALQTNQEFTLCKNCVSACEASFDGIEAFDCENTCRDRMDKYCVLDSDCACGKNVEGDCFYGRKSLVNISEQCPDYCSGIAGNLLIKCVNNACVQV